MSTMFWSFSILAFVECHNLWRMGDDDCTLMMRMLRLTEFPDLKLEHTFGHSIYVLDSRLQSSSIGLSKWDTRTKLGIYVGRLPYHAGLVALVLNPRISNMSS